MYFILKVIPSRQSDVETTSKRRQRMSSNRRRKRIENANGIDVEKLTSFQRLEIDVVSTSINRRRISTSMNRCRFNLWKSISFPCFIFDVVSMFKSK